MSWIKDPGFVDMSEDFIAHDVIINQYAQKLTGVIRQDFEKFTDNARKDFFDFSDEEFNSFIHWEK